MNQVIDNILTRRSVRDFTQEEVKVEDIEVLLQSAIYAQTGANQQTWKFTAVLNKNVINELAQAVAKALGKENYTFYNATALILTSNVDSKWGRDDNACAMQNIALAAHSLGLSSVWINQFIGNCSHPEVRKALNKINVPENHLVFGVAALGYATKPLNQDVIKKGLIEIIK